MNLREYLRRPVSPPSDDSTRMVLKRAIAAGKGVRQERFNYYYWYGWFDKLGNKWSIQDLFVNLTINLSRFSRELGGKDKDPVAVRNAAKTLRTVARKCELHADILDRRAERLEGQDTETEATD